MAFVALSSFLVLAAPSVAASSIVQTRDASVTWTLQGCYTDISTSRTLAGASVVNTTGMTVESCFAFCTGGGYNLAGVEFGSQCYCDYAVQASGTLSAESNCNTPCSGNSSEFCGAGNFINIYSNGAPLPVIPKTVGTWQYEGCFADSTSSRVLPHQQTIAGGVTVESCTSACKANGFAVAGVEFGQECWCSSSLPTSSLLSDNDCQTACTANTTEFCGGSSRLGVYEDTTGQICLAASDAQNFNLNAVFVIPPTTGAVSVPLHVKIINTVTLVSWSVLTTASDVFTSETLLNGGILPVSTSQPNFRTASLPVKAGDSPIFVTTQFPPAAAGPYCTMTNPVLGPSGPPVLAVSGRSDLWALCPNSTAAGRLDAVFNPAPNHPHYTQASCSAVYITLA